jgi:hypothetical protein
MPTTAYTWATSPFFRCASRRPVHPPLTRPRLSYCASPNRVVGSRWQTAVTVLPSPLARRVAAAACAAVQSTAPLFRRWRDRRQAAPATSPATRAAQATRIMQQMRSGPKQLRALAEELDARQEAKCQKREIDVVHDPPAQPDQRQKSDRSGETSQ